MDSDDNEIVFPGDILGYDGEYRAGNGCKVIKGNIVSTITGTKVIKSNYINIIPIFGKYSPRTRDRVIGIVVDVGVSNWMVDINMANTVYMHPNDVPWKVDFGTAERYIALGDVISAKVVSAEQNGKVMLTMKEPPLKVLRSGICIKLSPVAVPKIIGKKAGMIHILKSTTNCKLIVGQNGYVWMDGEDEDLLNLIKIITFISENNLMQHELENSVKEKLHALGYKTEDEKEKIEEENTEEN